MNVEVEIDDTEFKKAFRSWDGMFGRYLSHRAEVVAYQAVVAAPIYVPKGPLDSKQTGGYLKSKITVYYTSSNGELEARIGVNPVRDEGLGYAYYMHEGTKGHPIAARRAKSLRFIFGGYVFYRYSVYHPGTKPIRYLTPFLREAVR